jgi:hypothetical protein
MQDMSGPGTKPDRGLTLCQAIAVTDLNTVQIDAIIRMQPGDEMQLDRWFYIRRDA